MARVMTSASPASPPGSSRFQCWACWLPWCTVVLASRAQTIRQARDHRPDSCPAADPELWHFYYRLWLGLFWRVPFDTAAPAALIGTSNFFELAVAVAISLFGLYSGAALATVVGVLVEVPVMRIAGGDSHRTRLHFARLAHRRLVRPPLECGSNCGHGASNSRVRK